MTSPEQTHQRLTEHSLRKLDLINKIQLAKCKCEEFHDAYASLNLLLSSMNVLLMKGNRGLEQAIIDGKASGRCARNDPLCLLSEAKSWSVRPHRRQTQTAYQGGSEDATAGMLGSLPSREYSSRPEVPLFVGPT